MKELLRLYRDAWRKAGYPGQGRVMLAFHMFCAETVEEAIRVARQPLNHYLKTLVAAAADWTEELNSKDYPRKGGFRRRAGWARRTLYAWPNDRSRSGIKC
jgi:alkanesulfonate monooxygenase SsuD/methylene tetrahydromethanopterin reductase-like flavin-dependent oxidoreductase (luciferase family)